MKVIVLPAGQAAVILQSRERHLKIHHPAGIFLPGLRDYTAAGTLRRRLAGETDMLAVEERIQMLRDRFAESLPERVVQLRRTWMRLCASPKSGDLQQEFERQLHTLGGTAGTYGLNHIAGLAVEGELACAELGDESAAETLLYLGSIIGDIGQAVDDWLTAPPLRPGIVREETISVEATRS